TVFDTCKVPDVPVQNCHQKLPFEGQTQIKLLGAFPLPWGMLGSATYLSLPGFPDNASLTYTNAQIAPSLGRNLAACGAATLATCTATVTIQVVPPNTLFEPRQNQVDLRLS